MHDVCAPCTHIRTKWHPATLQDLNKREGAHFSPDFNSGQSNSRQSQFEPIRGNDELTLSSYLSRDLLLECDIEGEAACSLHMGAYVMPKEAGGHSCLGLFGRKKNCCPVALVYTELLHYHQLLRDSAACPHIGVFVCACAHFGVCGHNMLWVDLLGSAFLLLLFQNLLFLSTFWGIGTYLWTF